MGELSLIPLSLSLPPAPCQIKSSPSLISTVQNTSDQSVSCHLSGHHGSLLLLLLPWSDPFLQLQQGKFEPSALDEWLPSQCRSNCLPAGVMRAGLCSAFRAGGRAGLPSSDVNPLAAFFLIPHLLAQTPSSERPSLTTRSEVVAPHTHVVLVSCLHHLK